MSHKVHKHHHINHHHHHEEGTHTMMLDGIDEEEGIYLEDQRPSRFKKVFIIVVSIFMIALMLSYFLLGLHTFDIIASMSESDVLDNLVLSSGDITVLFSPESYQNLSVLYLGNQEREIKVCLLGTIDDGTYSVNSLLVPEIYQQSYANVVSAECPAETIISMHTHPFRRCLASSQDFRSFDAFKRLNPDAAMMVMCELDRFYIYK